MASEFITSICTFFLRYPGRFVDRSRPKCSKINSRVFRLDRSREFSEIELILLEKIVNVCTSLLVEPWASVTAIEPSDIPEDSLIEAGQNVQK